MDKQEKAFIEISNEAYPKVNKTIQLLADLDEIVGDDMTSLKPAIWVLCQVIDEIEKVQDEVTRLLPVNRYPQYMKGE